MRNYIVYTVQITNETHNMSNYMVYTVQVTNETSSLVWVTNESNNIKEDIVNNFWAIRHNTNKHLFYTPVR